MGAETGISWCHHTFNPWRGCAKVAPECHHCYAEGWARRFSPNEPLWGPHAARQIAAESYWRQPLKWDADARQAGEIRLVFCASLADVFERRRELIGPRQRLFDLANTTKNLRWLLLTKRPENIVDLWPANETGRPFWLGMSCGSEKMAAKLPVFREAAESLMAEVAFLSCEPLLFDAAPVVAENSDWLDWVIAGGESGTHDRVRPTPAAWFRNLRDVCRDGRIPFHFKQWGSHDQDGRWVGASAGSGGNFLDGKNHLDYPRLYARG